TSRSPGAAWPSCSPSTATPTSSTWNRSGRPVRSGARLRGRGGSTTRAILPCVWTGLILAGGRSLRMGRDKADLLLRGRTLLRRAVDRVREAGGEPLIVGPAGPESGTGSCRRIDEEPGAGLEGRRGPLFALHHGLQVCGTRRAVALACDLPLVPARFLR